MGKENSMTQTVQRGKIKKAPAAEIVKYLIRPAIEADLVFSFVNSLMYPGFEIPLHRACAI